MKTATGQFGAGVTKWTRIVDSAGKEVFKVFLRFLRHKLDDIFTCDYLTTIKHFATWICFCETIAFESPIATSSYKLNLSYYFIFLKYCSSMISIWCFEQQFWKSNVQSNSWRPYKFIITGIRCIVEGLLLCTKVDILA